MGEDVMTAKGQCDGGFEYWARVVINFWLRICTIFRCKINWAYI